MIMKSKSKENKHYKDNFKQNLLSPNNMIMALARVNTRIVAA